ncbi:MAG: B12-binding domain-containing radical SAM protein [Vicingaceae bacterium]
MKVLFTHSYFLQFDKKQLELSKPYPPLATIQAAALLRRNNFEVQLFDTNFELEPKNITQEIEKFDPKVLVVYDDGFNYLTKMCLTAMREAALEMIRIAKKKGVYVLVSSSDSTDHYELYLDAGADAVILGEADETLLTLVNTFKTEKTIDEVAGIAIKKDNEIVKTEKRKILTNLDDLPLSAWDLLDISPYKNAWKKHGYFSINLSTTRGCPYKCNWCAKPIYGQRYNSRSPKHVVAEIKLIKSYFNFEHIWFSDDIFGLTSKWVQEFNKELKAENIVIKYKIQSRADLLLKDDTIIALAESGCDEVWIGAESGSQKILDAMDKGTEVAQIVESTRLMKKYGIKPCYFLQFGYLEETWEDIKKTLHLLFTQMPYDIGVSVSYPLPGTSFYEKVKSELSGKANWVDSDELLLMYESTYSPKFYKKLHRFLHKRFRQKQAFELIKKGKLTNVLRWKYFFLMSNLNYLQLLILKK